MEKKTNQESETFFGKLVASFQRKSFRAGLYATLVSVLVIAAVIVLNMIVSSLNLRKDLTTDGRYSLTEETKELLASTEDELVLYYLTKDDAEDPEITVTTYLNLYSKESGRVRYEVVDLLIRPQFAEEYTEKEAELYSVIVVNETTGRSRYIPYADMILTETSYDYMTFQMKEQTIGHDIEGKINAAIHYVVSGKQTNLYAVTGHGETELGETALNYLSKGNIQYQTLELMKAERVPEDCDVLYITSATADYTEQELQVLKEYAAAGGSFLIAATYQKNMDNFNELIRMFGVELGTGIILEEDSRYYVPGAQYELFPIIRNNHEITEAYSGGEYMPMLSSVALDISGTKDGTKEATVLLSTSTTAYEKTGQVTTLSKEENDAVGPFALGVYVKDTETQAEAVIYSTVVVFAEVYLKQSGFINADMMLNSINGITEGEAVSTVRTVLLNTEESLVVTAAEANTIGIVFVAVIPALLLLIGVGVMLRRKNR